MIKDIEPLEHIEDYSLFFSVIIAVFVITLIYFIAKNLLSKKESLKDKTLKKYKEIDFTNPKQASYKLTKYANILAENQKSKEIKERFIKELEKYKYKKDVPNFDNETKSLYYLFLEVVENE